MTRAVNVFGLVAVLLLFPKGAVNAGEVAGFPPDEADRMVEAGEATFDIDGTGDSFVDDDAVAEAERLAEAAKKTAGNMRDQKKA